MPAPVAKAKGIRHFKAAVRQHGRPQAVARMTFVQLFRRIAADGDNADTALVELRPEFFPAPQLGATIRSPVAAEELDEGELPGQVA